MMYTLPPPAETSPAQSTPAAAMSLLAVLIPSGLILLVAYRLYGGLLARLFRLDDATATPAVTLRDGREGRGGRTRRVRRRPREQA